MFYSEILESDFRYVEKTNEYFETNYITISYDLNKHKFIPLEILNIILEDKEDYELDRYKGICSLSVKKDYNGTSIMKTNKLFKLRLKELHYVFEKILINKKEYYISYTGSLYDENFNLLLGKVVTLDEIIKGTYNTQLLITSKVFSKKIKLYEDIRNYILDKNTLFYDNYKLDIVTNIDNLFDLNKSIIANKEEFVNSIKNELE